jgi:hypothetical protein
MEQNLIDKALLMAVRAHAGQLDLAGKPYILHPLRVAANHQDDAVLFIVGILHDVVEDTLGTEREVTISRIVMEFGMPIAWNVDCLTRRRPGIGYLEPAGGDFKVNLWPNKPELYLGEYIPRVMKNDIARTIKIEDLTDNLDPRRELPPEGNLLSRARLYYQALRILRQE